MTSFDRITVTRAAALGSATLHEAAGRVGALPAGIQAAVAGMTLAGPAFTVRCPPGDNLWIHRALVAASPGDVLVVETGEGEALYGYWGEIMSEAAKVVQLAGLVLQGGSRDHGALGVVGFPVFSFGPCIRGTIKDKARDHGRLGAPVTLGDITVNPGDLVVGDVDGVVVLAAIDVESVVAAGIEREAKERDTIDRLRAGATTLDLYDLQ